MASVGVSRWQFAKGAILGAAIAGCSCPARAAPADSAAGPDWVRAAIGAADIGALSLSPDRRYLAFRTTRANIDDNRYDLAWHVVALPSGQARTIGTAGEPIVRDPGIIVSEAPIWSPDSRWIYYRALVGGEVQLWRTSVIGGRSERVTGETGDIELVEPSADGKGIRLGIGPDRSEIEQAELREYDEGILVDAHVDLAQSIFRGAIINGRHRTQRLTGRWFERRGVLEERPLRYRQLDLASMALAEAPGEVAREPANDGPVSRSDRGELASASWRDGASVLTVISQKGAAFICRAKPCRTERIAWLQWRPGGRRLLFATSDQSHAQKLLEWDVRSGRVRFVLDADGLVGGGRPELPCAVAGRAVICVTAAAGAPPRLEEIDLKAEKRRILFDPNPELRRWDWPKIERLAWQSADGRRFSGVLFRSTERQDDRLPLFINYYRCEGFVRGGVGDEWPFAALAAQGIASVCINATSMEGPQDGIGQYRAALGGIEALVDILDRRGLVDRRRVGIGGLSFGSEVAMWAAIHSKLIAAASLGSPQFEPSAFWFNGLKGRDYRDVLKKVWGLGAPEETPDQWKIVSPAFSASRIKVPILMQLSEQEARYAIELHGRLSHSSTPIEVYAFPDEPHLKVQPRHRLAAYQRNLDWFRFWLLGKQANDPAKAAQYGRWRALQAQVPAVQGPLK